MASRKYADLGDVGFFDWAASMSQQDPFSGADIDSFVSGLMRGNPAKTEKFAAFVPTFVAKLQEPECLPHPSAPSAPAADAHTGEEFNPFLSCGTCFVPTLDLSPDEHGVGVNAFGSTGALDASTAPRSSSLLPVVVKPATDGPAPQVVEFRQMVDCPTCFIPSTDLSPDEHGTMVNRGGTRTVAAVESSIPEPEFLSYDPLEDEIAAPVSACGPQPVEDLAAWDPEVEGVGAGMCDPFTSLWDRSVYGQPEYACGAGVDDGVDEDDGRMGMKRGQRYEDWEETPMKRKRTSALPADADTGSHSRNLCPRATRILKEWMTSPEHFDHPYPDEKEKLELAAKAGITTKQLTIWFTNARKRLWVPMRKRQGLPIIGFAEYRTEQKKRYIEEQQRCLKNRAAGLGAEVSGPTPFRPVPGPELFRVQPLLPGGMKPNAMAASMAPQRFVIGNVTFDTAVEPAGSVLSKMDGMAKSLAAERRELSARMLQIEQQERSLRSAMQTLKQ